MTDGPAAALCSSFYHISVQAVPSTVFPQPVSEHSRGTNHRLTPGDSGVSGQAACARSPWSAATLLLDLHCSLTRVHPTFRVSFPWAQTCVTVGQLCQPPPAPSPFSLTDVSPNTFLVCLFMSWCLFLGGPKLTAVSSRHPFNSILVIPFTFSFGRSLVSWIQGLHLSWFTSFFDGMYAPHGSKIVEFLHDWKLYFNLTLEGWFGWVWNSSLEIILH